MKPLILDFAEVPEKIDLDYSLIEYSEDLNLSVLKGTNDVAIEKANLDTETVTKAIGESSDRDRNCNNTKALIDTMTKRGDGSTDTDFSDIYKMKNIMDTKTYTHTVLEETDNDKNLNTQLKSLMDTRTITEVAKEQSDKDR